MNSSAHQAGGPPTQLHPQLLPSSFHRCSPSALQVMDTDLAQHGAQKMNERRTGPRLGFSVNLSVESGEDLTAWPLRVSGWRGCGRQARQYCHKRQLTSLSELLPFIYISALCLNALVNRFAASVSCLLSWILPSPGGLLPPGGWGRTT